MKPTFDFSPLCQSFFSKRLMAQCKASPHTISAYAQTFRLLMAYAQKRLHLPPSKLSLAQLDAAFIAEFLDDLESARSNGTRTRNAQGYPSERAARRARNRERADRRYNVHGHVHARRILPVPTRGID